MEHFFIGAALSAALMIPPPTRLYHRRLEEKIGIVCSVICVAQFALWAARRNESKPDIILSPRDNGLVDADLHPYPLDALPGARDVDTPYGSIRVYEWGPDDGRKVLLIHGISTPSIALGPLAHRLVEKGCRVMLFDLFGRGHSSTPSPQHHPQNTALFTTQILLTLTTSPLPWTSSNSITLIGYSLGGALAASFTSYFPSLINSLILIAPGGLIRENHVTWKSRLLYSNIIPETWVQRIVAGRLWTPKAKGGKGREPDADADVYEKEKENDKEKGGLRSNAVYQSSSLPLLPNRPHSTVSEVVNWQIKHHRGFIPSFISSIQHAPIHAQHARWSIIGARLSRQRELSSPGISCTDAEKQDAENHGLENGKVLVILGERDPIIVAEEVEEDVRAVFGEEGVVVKVLGGVGHEVPIERTEEVAGVILGFWGEVEGGGDLGGSYGSVVMEGE